MPCPNKTKLEMPEKYTLNQLIGVKEQILKWLSKGNDPYGHASMPHRIVRINEESNQVEIEFHTYFHTYRIIASPGGFMATLIAVDPLADRKFCGGLDMHDSSEFNEENWNILLTEFLKSTIINSREHLIDVLKQRLDKRKSIWESRQGKKEENDATPK